MTKRTRRPAARKPAPWSVMKPPPVWVGKAPPAGTVPRPRRLAFVRDSGGGFGDLFEMFPDLPRPPRPPARRRR